MALQTQDFTTLVRNQVAAIQAASEALLDFTEGSVLLAVVESNSGAVALFLQALADQLLALTRASTSEDSDLDTWMADFGFTRLPAVAATGNVTFSRFTPTEQAIIPANSTEIAQVQTADGTQTYSVVIDTTNPNYNSALGGYVILAGTSSIDVPIEADVAGAGGNAAIDAINTIISPIPNVDTVTNSAAFTNGIDKESDDAFRARFIAYLLSLVRGTVAAINYAITSTQQGVKNSLVENQQYNGALDYGYFYGVVDDGTGNPSSDLITRISNNVELYRACGIRYGIFGPVVVTANVAMTITVASGYTAATVKTTVQSALQTYINSLPIGGTLYYTRLMQVAYDASPGVLDVVSVTLNSGSSDITATEQQIVKSGTITVS